MKKTVDGKHLFVVIAYDVCDDRRRARVCRELGAYGQRVEYSVFECWLSPLALSRLQQALAGIVDLEEDRIRYYILCKECRRKTVAVGTKITRRKVAIVV